MYREVEKVTHTKKTAFPAESMRVKTSLLHSLNFLPDITIVELAWVKVRELATVGRSQESDAFTCASV